MRTGIPAALGLAPAQIRAALVAAGRAPSVHNTQPWLFRLRPSTIELHAEPSRRLLVSDPDGVEQRMSCGAALFNLRVALAGHGVDPVVSIAPDRAQPDLLAVVRA